MRRIFCTVSATLLVLGFVAPSALCAGQDGHETPPATADNAGESAEDHAAEDEHTSAEPSILSGNPGNIFFTLLIFLSVVFILGRFAWKPLLAALQKREDLIRSSIEDAKHERQEADKLLAKYREQIDCAREEATAIVEEGKRDATVVKDGIVADAKRESEAMTARAKAEIERAKDVAVEDIHKRAVELSYSITEKLIAKSLGPEEHKELVEGTIKSYAETSN